MEAANDRLRKTIKLPVDLIGEHAQEFLSSARREFALTSVRNLEIDGSEFRDHETMLYLNFNEEIRLDDESLGQANGVYLTKDGSATLHFDETGALKEYEIDRPSENEDAIATFKAEIQHLLDEGGIYFAKPGESVDLFKLPKGQNFVIFIDNSGKKRLERVRFG